MKHTKEQKQEYFKQLRTNWQNAKQQLTDEKICEIEAIIKTHGMDISATGFMFVSIQMRHLGLDGIPYLDAKTYKGWKENGYHVKKGEKSLISGITWINCNKDDEQHDNDFVFPKSYHLFHRSQVEEIN